VPRSRYSIRNHFKQAFSSLLNRFFFMSTFNEIITFEQQKSWTTFRTRFVQHQEFFCTKKLFAKGWPIQMLIPHMHIKHSLQHILLEMEPHEGNIPFQIQVHSTIKTNWNSTPCGEWKSFHRYKGFCYLSFYKWYIVNNSIFQIVSGNCPKKI